MNLKGGYKILSLVTLVLIASVDGTTATDITDVNTLEQLDSLKEFLDVSKQLKPILLRVKPSKEKVVMAELSRIDDVTLLIYAKLDGYELNIVVSFEQDEETLLWYIDEAQYLYVADALKVVNEVAKAEEGDIVDVLGLDEDGQLVKGTVSGGTKLYKHVISYTKDDGETPPQSYGIVLISISSSPVITQLSLETLVQNALQILMVSGELYGDTIVGATGSMIGEAIGVIVDGEGSYYNKQLFISSVTSVSDTVTEL